MKNILKISALTILSIIIIKLLFDKQLIHFDLIARAVTKHGWIIMSIACLQILTYVMMGLRYQSILKILKCWKPIRDVFAATFVGNGIGQWLPGSIAFIEVIRLNLLTKSNVQVQSFNTPLMSQNIAHLTIGALFDRLIGLFVGLFVGTLIGLYFIFSLEINSTAQYWTLLMILMFNGFLCFLILLLPVLAGSKLMQYVLMRGERVCLKLISYPSFHKLIKSFFYKVNEIVKLFSLHGKNYKLFLIPIGLSACSLFSAVLSLQLASYALETSLPFFVTFAVISILSIITILPVSVGGMGVPQLATALLFSAFGANSADAASAQFLQTGVMLITISICAVFYLPRIIKEIIKPRIA